MDMLDLPDFAPPSAEISPPLRISFIDKYAETTGLKLEIIFSHFFEVGAVYFYIRFDTPAGTLIIDPKKHFSFCCPFDLGNVASRIYKGLKGNRKKIVAACMEELFSIEILRCRQDEEDEENTEFIFTFTVDTAKILSDSSTESSVGLTMTVDAAKLEEFAGFFVKVGKRYAQYLEENIEYFGKDELDMFLENFPKN